MDARVLSRLRRLLDALYRLSGAAAACCLAGICVVMLTQVAGREAGILLRGADDITAWLCAASAFFALAHTFRRGELVRMMLVVDRLPPSARNRFDAVALAIATLFAGFMLWSVTRFVYESWQINEVAQGLLRIPIWIPQLSFVIGVWIFFVAVADELVSVLRGHPPAFRIAEEERSRSADFTETL